MLHSKKSWSYLSIQHKVMTWVIAILVLVAISTSVSIVALEWMIRDYESLSIDNYKCYEVQKAIDAERSIFQDLIREPGQRNQTRFAKACVKTHQCIAALPMKYSDIGEDRYARTWNLRNGYYGYVEYRDKLLAMDASDRSYATELYRVVEMQDSLSEYSLRLIQETMEYGNRHYNSQKEALLITPVILITLSILALVFVFSILRLLTAMVVHPILLLAEESRSIAANDFSRQDLQPKSHDEIGELIRSFNRMKHAMADYIATREQLHKEAMEKLEMEKNMEHIRLEMLKSQVNPHFLFNTLNMISCMARLEDAETTDQMTVALGNLFRYNLRTKEQEVYLEQELDALDDYMYIQQMRFDGRITYKKDIRVDTYSTRIPSFTLQPIVENALTHGMKTKEEGGRILLRIWQEGNMLTISLMDNGQGMNMEERTALHQKILNSEKTGRSIGLGNIYRRMAMLYPDGELKVYSKEGRGTIIQLRIPQKEEKKMKYKVLIAEDELIERMVLCKILRKHLGELCDIFESKNGREALEVYQREQPQIAILDIEMPGINGLEVARKIRESGQDCAILFLTGFDKFSYAKQAISVRALEYLLKPYNEQELIYAVEEAMQHASRFIKKEARKEDPAEEIPQAKDDDNENVRISLIREDIRTYIGKNYQNDISMQSAAQFMGYSEAYFCKLFKQCFRVNFSAYLNEYRIDKAKVMMADPRINIKDIGTACGYSDSNYFARVFKRITGQTPSDYRLAAAEKAIKG